MESRAGSRAQSVDRGGQPPSAGLGSEKERGRRGAGHRGERGAYPPSGVGLM